MPSNLVFTLTAGRTGTNWLAAMLGANLPDCEAHHEILGYDRFGHDSPDLSHLTLFNSKGNCDEVRGFWERKADRVGLCEAQWYVETSHVLMKAGLVEHLELFSRQGPVHLIVLTRDAAQIVASLTQRGDMVNVGNQWLWYLDPDYPQNILDSAPFKASGLAAIRLWYVLEIQARQGYYEAMVAEMENVHVHRYDLSVLREEAGSRSLLSDLGCDLDTLELPAPKNITQPGRRLGSQEKETIEKLVASIPGDAVDVGRQFFSQGFRLGQPRS